MKTKDLQTEPVGTPPTLPNLSDASKEELYSTGYELYRNGKYGDAKAFFRMLTLVEPTTKRFWVGLGACNKMLKMFDDAINTYGIAAVLDPDDPYIHWHAADCFFQTGNRQMALATLASAIATAKNDKKHVALVSKLELLHTVWSGNTGNVKQ